MKITVPRKQLNAFRTACRKVFPCETIALLCGSRTQEGVVITEIKSIEHTGDLNEIGDYSEALLRSKISVLRKQLKTDPKSGIEFLGTIHSHTYREEDPCCEHMSPTDINSALRDGEIVCGIVYVYAEGKRSAAYFYQPTALPTVELI